MPTCTTCDDSILNPKIAEKPFCIECAEAQSKCGLGKFPADCVIYHLDDETPTKLTHIGAPNGSSVSAILEALDRLVGYSFNTPITPLESKTIFFTASGTANHTIKAEVKLSTSLGNLIEIKDDGIFMGTTDLGKIRVKESGSLDYLAAKVIGDTDGIVSISTKESNDLLKVVPSLDVENLITDIRNNHLNSFNQLIQVSSAGHSNDGNIINMQSKLAPYIAYPYHGSLTNFDSNGKGIVANGFDKIYICNGLNGTPDYRGRSPIGANVGVPGGDLDSQINPANPDNISISLNQKVGEYKHVLTDTESASHTHDVNDQGHSHFTVVHGADQNFLELNPTYSINFAETTSGTDRDYHIVGNSGTPTMGKTDTKASNISISPNTGGGNAHNTTHPVIGTVFIMYIP